MPQLGLDKWLVLATFHGKCSCCCWLILIDYRISDVYIWDTFLPLNDTK